MSYMMTQYTEVPLDHTSPYPYRLMRFTDPSFDYSDNTETCKPILFVPGNKGSYKQVRAIGYWLENHKKQSQCYTIYSVDLLEQMSVLSVDLIKIQSQFVVEVVNKLNADHKDIPIVIGHSMGSIVINRAIAELKVNPTFISLASPVEPLIHVEKMLWTNDIDALSINGGYGDIQVLPDGRSISSETIPLVWAAPHHQAIVWVHQLVQQLGSYIQNGRSLM